MAHTQLVVFDSKVCFQARHGVFQESTMNTHHFLRWFQENPPFFEMISLISPKKILLENPGDFRAPSWRSKSWSWANAIHPGATISVLRKEPMEITNVVFLIRNLIIRLFNIAMGNDPFIDGLPINVVFAGSGIWSCISFFEISPLFLRGDIKWWNDNANVGADNSPFLEVLDRQMTLNQIPSGNLT